MSQFILRPSRPRIVMSRGQLPNQVTKGGGDTNTTHVSRVLFGSGPYPISDLQFLFGWMYFAGGGAGEGSVGNTGTISAAMEINGHSGRRVYFDNGAQTHVANDPSLFLTDIYPELILGPYSTGFVRSMVQVTAGQFWPFASFNGTSTGAQKGTAITGQLLSSGAVSGGTGEAGQYGPVAVIGKSAGPCLAFVILGASIEDGTGDTKDASGLFQPVGYCARGLIFDPDGVTSSAPIPYSKLTMGSETIAALVEPNTGQRRLTVARYGTDIFIGGSMVGNDVSAGTAPATIQANLQRLYGGLKAMSPGCRLWQGNISGRTTGTFTSLGGQTYATNFGPGSNADTMNQWFPTQLVSSGGGGYLDGVFDAKAISGDPSDQWKFRSDGGVAFTGDGTHYAQNLHILEGQGLRTFINANCAPMW